MSHILVKVSMQGAVYELNCEVLNLSAVFTGQYS